MPGLALAFQPSGKDNVDIDADEIVYDKAENKLFARGNVKLVSGETSLEADNLTYSQDEEEAMVEGSFVFTDGSDVITGDDMNYNFRTSLGSMSKASIFIEEENFRITGENIRKVGTNNYSISGAEFTTCDGDSPSWIIKASNIDVEIGEYLFADHARLYLNNVPVLYVPKFIAPVKTERQTGLLTPKAGYSDRDGFTYEQPLFIAIAKNQDATITFNSQGDRGRGGDLEYRYVRTKDSDGRLDFQYLKERPPLDGERWWGNLRHREDLSSTMHGKADLNVVSDANYFLEYGDNVNIYTQQRLESKASLLKNWSNYSLLTELRHQKNLIVEEDTTLQKLPEMTFTAKRQRIGSTPLFLQAESRLTNFWREEADETAGLYSGQRLDLYPSLSLPFAPGNMFELTPQIGLRETIYQTKNRVDERQNRNMYDLVVDFLIPFSRVYDTGGDEIKKIKHSIEPGVTYTYIPDVDQSDLPLYDGIDRIGRASRVRLLINNYITVRLDKNEDDVSYNRLIDLKLYSDYDFIEADRSLSSSSDRRKPWGPITGRLTVTNDKNVRLESEMRYDTYQDKTTYLSADLEGNYERLTRLKLSYRYAADPKIEYMDGAIKIAPLDDLILAYRGRYSMTDKLFLESLYGALITRQCWAIALTFSKRLVPEEKRFFIEVNLKGLGEIGKRGELL